MLDMHPTIQAFNMGKATTLTLLYESHNINTLWGNLVLAFNMRYHGYKLLCLPIYHYQERVPLVL